MNNKLDSRKSGIKKILPLIYLLLAITPIMAVRSADAIQSPEQRISLNIQNRSLRDILDEIKKQTNIGFSINNSVDAERIARLSVRAANESLSTVLGRLLANTGCEFMFVGNNIVIVTADANRRSESGQQHPRSQIQVTGRIVNEDTGEPVAGVSIRLKSNPLAGVSSGSDGRFSMTIPSNVEILVISSVGMHEKEYKLPDTYRSGSYIEISLKIKKQAMDEVVVLGVFQKPLESFTGAITSISARELEQYGSRDILSTIRNIDPSFNIVENNDWGSDPNRLPEINLRGVSSLPNLDELTDDARSQLNTPLIMIDGFESTLSALHNMNQDEVAFINILKDAAATALYGSRGSNGVIIIETKPPAPGKLQISLKYNGGVEMPDLSSYSLLNAREKLDLEYKVGKYGIGRSDHDIPLIRYYYYLLDQVNQGIDTYWLAKPLRTGIRNNATLRAEGGDQVFRYALSLQLNNRQGVMKGDKNNNLNASVKLSYDYKTLRFSNNISVNNNNSKNSPYGSFSDYVTMNPYFNPYDEYGNPLKLLGMDPSNPIGVQYRWGSLNGVGNPLYNAMLGSFNKSEQLSLTNNFDMAWKITPELELRGGFGINKSNGNTHIFVSPDDTSFAGYTNNNLLRRGTYSISETDIMSYSGTATLMYLKTFADKHLLQAGVSYNIRDSKSEMYYFMTEGFTNPDMAFVGTALQYASGTKPSGSISETREMGVNVNASYVFDNRYTIEGTARYDGSSLFGSDKRFGLFWSLGAAWIISNEKFLKDNEVINRLRIFTNAGTTGSTRFSPYQAITTYKYHTDKRYYTWMGAELMSIGNPDLQWEKQMGFSLGLESAFLNNRLQLKINTYHNTTTNLLSSVDIPTHTGFSSYKENVGKVRNTGYEIYLTAEIIKIPEKGISWSISPSLIHNNNKILRLSQAMKDAQSDNFNTASTSPKTYYIEGHTSRAIWAVRSLGVDPSTGKEMFRDRYGNVTFIYDPQDMTEVGNADPKAWGNINTYFRWKDLSLTVSFGYRWGGQQYNSTLMNKVENTNYNGNVDSRVYTDRWQNPGDQVFFKSIYVTSTTYVTSRFVQDDNRFACQNVKLEYMLRNINGFRHMRNIRLSMDMADIFYLSTIKRERGTSYPFSRTISYTISATF